MNEELHLSFGSSTDTGLKKEFNTDTALNFKILDGHVFVVCDGHDGVEGHGALAAKLVSESIKKYFYSRSYKDMVKALANAISYANVALYEQSQKDSKYKEIGSTLAIAIFRENKLYYAYAGDSRIYALRENKLSALTRDHVANPQNPSGEEVQILLGKSKDLKFGVCKNPVTVTPGDVFMLCTDGLTDQLNNDELLDIVADAHKAPEHKCLDLIELTKEKGGEDCVSVQVLEFSKAVEPVKAPKSVKLKPLLYILIALLGVMALSYGGNALIKYLNNQPTKHVKAEKPKQKEQKKPEKQKAQDKKTSVENLKTEQNKVVNVVPKKEPVQVKKVKYPVYYEHKVVYGENLYRLGLRYGVGHQKLIDINGNKATNLVAGSKLKIPVKAIHKVKPGESFSVISDKYNVKIKAICMASKISETAPLKDGQTLIIPLVK